MVLPQVTFKKQKTFSSNKEIMTYCIVFTWSPLLFVFRASGTVYTAIDIATGQEVGFLYPPPYFSSPSYISLYLNWVYSRQRAEATKGILPVLKKAWSTREACAEPDGCLVGLLLHHTGDVSAFAFDDDQ